MSKSVERQDSQPSELKPDFLTSERIVIKERGGRVSGILTRDDGPLAEDKTNDFA
jgi:hypothetical protein